MKISITQNALRVLFFNCLTIMQSCKVYNNSFTSLEQNTTTTDVRFKKIKTNKGKTYHLRRMETREGKFYGSKLKNGEMELQGFMVEDIVSIRIQNKSASIAATVLVSAGIGLGITFAVFLLNFDLNLGTFSY